MQSAASCIRKQLTQISAMSSKCCHGHNEQFDKR